MFSVDFADTNITHLVSHKRYATVLAGSKYRGLVDAVWRKYIGGLLASIPFYTSGG
jgi:hypothetical protein